MQSLKSIIPNQQQSHTGGRLRRMLNASCRSRTAGAVDMRSDGYVQSTARQTIQNCQTSPEDFQRYSLHPKAQI
jgi:hypothetical protein